MWLTDFIIDHDLLFLELISQLKIIWKILHFTLLISCYCDVGGEACTAMACHWQVRGRERKRWMKEDQKRKGSPDLLINLLLHVFFFVHCLSLLLLLIKKSQYAGCISNRIYQLYNFLTDFWQDFGVGHDAECWRAIWTLRKLSSQF